MANNGHVGRHRKDNSLGLEKRVYWHKGQFRYRHRDGKWEGLGTDVAKANARARVYNDPNGLYGTFGYWLDCYLADAEAGRLPAGRKKAPRTISDNKIEAEYLKAALGKLYPQDIANNPRILSEYRDRRIRPDGRGATRANRELSLTSALFAWLIELNHCPGLTVNPVRFVRRFTEKPKERYVEDHEYQAVYAIALRSVCMAMALAYRTLQRPGDLLRIGASSFRTKTIGGVQKRVLTVTQGKTGQTVDIEITPELEDAVTMLSGDGPLGKLRLSESVTKLVPSIIHTTAGEAYTEDGIGAMLRRYCKKAGVPTFGLMDIRAKGATDMYLHGTPLEVIQVLMGHTSVQTTEIYIKRLIQTVQIAKPNAVAISGGKHE